MSKAAKTNLIYDMGVHPPPMGVDYRRQLDATTPGPSGEFSCPIHIDEMVGRKVDV